MSLSVQHDATNIIRQLALKLRDLQQENISLRAEVRAQKDIIRALSETLAEPPKYLGKPRPLDEPKYPDISQEELDILLGNTPIPEEDEADA